MWFTISFSHLLLLVLLAFLIFSFLSCFSSFLFLHFTHSSLAPFYCVNMILLVSFLFLLRDFRSLFLHFLFTTFFRVYFIGSYVRVFFFAISYFVCVSFASFFVLFVSISYICLLAKFIRFSASVFSSSLSNSHLLSSRFSLISRFYVLFPCLLYTQSHSSFSPFILLVFITLFLLH